MKRNLLMHQQLSPDNCIRQNWKSGAQTLQVPEIKLYIKKEKKISDLRNIKRSNVFVILFRAQSTKTRRNFNI